MILNKVWFLKTLWMWIYYFIEEFINYLNLNSLIFFLFIISKIKIKVKNRVYNKLVYFQIKAITKLYKIIIINYIIIFHYIQKT
jgi:hypothetical protein